MIYVTKSEMAYQILTELIETGQLEAGAVLSEAQLMERVGVGRTPLREATQLLSRDRLLKLRPGSGVEIPTLTVDEQLARLEVRRSLEMLAVGLASERGTDEQLSKIEQHASHLESITNVTEYTAGVRKAHSLIWKAAHNEYLEDAMTPLQGLSRRFWLAHIVDEATEIQQGRDLYVAALRAVVAKDTDRARQSIRGLNDHLVHSALEAARRKARQGQEQSDNTQE